MLVCFFVCNFIWYCMHLHWYHLKNLMLEFYKTIILRLKILFYFKGTLMEIWKSLNVFAFIWKQYPENFAFLFRKILEFAQEVWNSKIMLIFILFYFLCIFVNKVFTYLKCAYLKTWKGVLIWNLRHIVFMWRRRYWQILKSALSFRI